MGRKFERNSIVIKRGRSPTSGAVTGSALRAECAGMCIIFEMACGTVHGRAFEESVDMAICASGGCMLTVKMECEFRVVNFGRLPTLR
jgi:hypothetical protein